MTAQIFLIAPADADADSFPKRLQAVLAAADVAALLLPKGSRDEAQYEALASAILPVAQAADCAVLLEDAPDLAKKIGADGVHITTGQSAVKAAVAAMKPDMIVGAGDIGSRHFAMTVGETGVDYLFFGASSGESTPEDRENAEWWAETFEIPAVWSDPAAPIDTVESADCEFVAIGDALWSAPEGAEKAIASVIQALERTP